MTGRARVLVLALVLLTAGCLGAGGERLQDSGDDQPADREPDGAREEDGNRTQGSSEDEDGSEDTSEEDRREEEQTGSDEDDEANASGEQGPPPWPDRGNATIRPGVQVHGAGQCTSSFLFRTPDNATLMLSLAAHCLADAPAIGSNGCADGVEPDPPGTEVGIDGASQPGRLVYSSWYTMQQTNASEAACRSNDLALVAIDEADRDEVHPAVLDLGGPTEIAPADAIAPGQRVQWYGNTAATPGGSATSHHRGAIVEASDWRFQAYSASPGLPGDSGSGIMLADGSAAGVLATVNTIYPGANSATRLPPALAFAHEHGLTVELVTWPMLASGPLH